MELIELYNCLSGREKDCLESFAKLKYTRSIKVERTLDVLKFSETISDQELAIELGETAGSSTFSRMKKNIRELIYDVIIINIDSRGEELSSRTEDRLKSLRSYLVTLHLMQRNKSRDAYTNIKKNYNKINRQSGDRLMKLILGEYILSSYGLRYLSTTTKCKLANEIESTHSLLLALCKSEALYARLQQLTIGKIGFSREDIESVKHDVNSIFVCTKSYGQPDLLRIRLKAKIIQCHVERNYYSMISIINDLQKLNEKDKSVYRTEVAGGYLMRGNCCVQLERYDEAEMCLKKSIELFSPGCVGNINASISFACLLFVREDLGKVKKLLLGLVSDKEPGNNEQREIIRYMCLVALVHEKKWLEVLSGLLKIRRLYVDKLGYRIGVKILEFICLIELRQYDNVDLRIDSFRKLLYSNSRERIERPNAIYRVMRNIMSTGFDFQITYMNRNREIENLRNGEDEFFWDPLGYELIRFDKWFDEKLQEEMQIKSRRRKPKYRRAKRIRGYKP